MSLSFRPLDGESFSKQYKYYHHKLNLISFRPLDGESFSKQEGGVVEEEEAQ